MPVWPSAERRKAFGPAIPSKAIGIGLMTWARISPWVMRSTRSLISAGNSAGLPGMFIRLPGGLLVVFKPARLVPFSPEMTPVAFVPKAADVMFDAPVIGGRFVDFPGPAASVLLESTLLESTDATILVLEFVV